MPDMLGINVLLFFWQTQLLNTAKVVENVKRRYKEMYINFALCRHDNEGDTAPRNTVVMLGTNGSTSVLEGKEIDNVGGVELIGVMAVLLTLQLFSDNMAVHCSIRLSKS